MFPGYFLDLGDLFRGSQWRPDRSAEWLELDVRLESAVGRAPFPPDAGGEPAAVLPPASSLTLKIELTDEPEVGGLVRRVYALCTVSSTQWQTLRLRLPTAGDPGDFTHGDVAGFDRRRVSGLSVLVEQTADNPQAVQFALDNVQLRDQDGPYDDLELLKNAGDDFTPEQEQALLELVRNSSFQYFVDFASPNGIAGLNNGGMIQDRGPQADLLSIGGVGFQLTAYAIGAERELTSQVDALERVRSMKRCWSRCWRWARPTRTTAAAARFGMPSGGSPLRTHS